MKKTETKEFEGKEKLLGQLLEVVSPLAKNKGFIAGGCALGIATDKPFNDIDVYWTCPMKEDKWTYLSKLYAKTAYKVSQATQTEDYDGSGDWAVIGQVMLGEKKVQLIWVKAKIALSFNQFMESVLEKFDIDLCKIAIHFNNGEPEFYRSKKHMRDYSNKTLTLNLGLSYPQSNKTLMKRLPKYVGKFPKFKVEITGGVKKGYKKHNRGYTGNNDMYQFTPRPMQFGFEGDLLAPVPIAVEPAEAPGRVWDQTAELERFVQEQRAANRYHPPVWAGDTVATEEMIEEEEEDNE